jgi:hypothetical protein
MFLLFRFYNYYPCGGREDFAGRFDSLEDAVAAHLSEEFKTNRADVYDVNADEWHDISKWTASNDRKEPS